MCAVFRTLLEYYVPSQQLVFRKYTSIYLEGLIENLTRPLQIILLFFNNFYFSRKWLIQAGYICYSRRDVIVATKVQASFMVYNLQFNSIG